MNLITPPSFNTLIQKITSSSDNLEILVTPLEKNLGVTLGNTLRRILYGFTPGWAITSVEIDNVTHQFSSIYGMKEDINDLIVNLKSISISMNGHGPSFIYINKTGPAVITANDIVCPPEIKIINGNQYLCTLNEESSLNMRMTVEAGIGHVPASYYSNRAHTDNKILLDVAFCPVTHVCYHVKHFTFYEELVFHVQTNGSVSPLEVVESSLAILRKKF